jgi:two-component system, OmpR family, response regulator MprA
MARVLVVDDEPAVRRALERALRLENHDVTLAEDGEQALDVLAGGSTDAVILDILMPKLDGLEVCRRLRKAGDRTPVLMLTAATGSSSSRARSSCSWSCSCATPARC